MNGAVLWANLHLLFWLSLFPFATAWMGENHFAALPSALYGVVLLMAGCAYWILQQAIILAGGTVLRRAVGRDLKGKLSPLAYITAILVTPWSPWVSEAIYVAVALMWLVPDRRIAVVLEHEPPAA